MDLGLEAGGEAFHEIIRMRAEQAMEDWARKAVEQGEIEVARIDEQGTMWFWFVKDRPKEEA